MHGGGYPMHSWMWPMMIAWWVFIAALIVLVVVTTIWLIRSSRKFSPAGSTKASAALKELDLRYARGELEREDYLQRKSDLVDEG